MDVSINDPASQLADLVKRAEAGEDIVLTLNGRPAARITPVDLPVDLEERRKKLLDLSGTMALDKVPGADAAHASDWMFDEFGLPG